MKVVFTLIFALLVSFSAMAQSVKKEVKVETKNFGVELNITIKKEDVKSTQITRVYMNKNYRVKKALNFTTKRNKSKIA